MEETRLQEPDPACVISEAAGRRSVGEAGSANQLIPGSLLPPGLRWVEQKGQVPVATASFL